MSGLRKPTAVFVSALCIALVIALFAPVQVEAGNVAQELEKSFVDIAENVRPSIVHLSTQIPLPGQTHGETDGEKAPRFLPPQFFKADVSGTGVIMDKEGYILTNDHLIVKGSEEITVRLAVSDGEKGKEYKGKIIGRDSATDLAVIKIEPDQPLQPAKLGDSAGLKVGQWAIAIGDPFGNETSMTVGVISGLGRSGFGGPLSGVRYQNFIQTDASINQGNSGGPLLNIDGEVIGINTFINAAAQGIGFATPIKMAKEVYAQLVEHGEVIRGFLGVQISDLDEALAGAFKVKEVKGALVTGVFPDTPAKTAGVRRGDIIREVDRQKIDDSKDLQNIIGRKLPGDKVHLAILRPNKEKEKPEEKEITIELMKFPEQTEARKPPKKKDNLLGLSVGKIPADVAREDEKGVIITGIKPGGPAEEAELIPGDIILEVDMQEVSNRQEFENIVSAIKPGDYVSFYIRRGDNILYRALKIPHAKK